MRVFIIARLAGDRIDTRNETSCSLMTEWFGKENKSTKRWCTEELDY